MIIQHHPHATCINPGHRLRQARFPEQLSDFQDPPPPGLNEAPTVKGGGNERVPGLRLMRLQELFEAV